jgi:hypothetical protein
MKGHEAYKPLKKMLKEEQKNLLTGLVAFSVAVLILAMQGSLLPGTSWGIFGLCLLSASIPVGITAYLLQVKVLSADKVPHIGHSRSEDCSVFAMSLTILGFLFMLWEFSSLLTSVLAVSFVGSVTYLAHVMRAWDAEIKSLEDEKKAED